MKSAFKLLVAAGLLVAFCCVAQAADVEGILLDKKCSAKIMKEGQEAAQAHTRQCALMPDCAKSGYGVLTADGKFISFDEAGNKKAIQALKASKKKDNLKATVTGEQSGETIKVASIKLL